MAVLMWIYLLLAQIKTFYVYSFFFVVDSVIIKIQDCWGQCGPSDNLF